MQRKSQSFSIRQAAVEASVFALSMVACAASMAAENGLQRYSAGVGGSDMTSPVVPGWYWQTATVYYKADKTMGNDGNPAKVAGTLPVSLDVSTVALLNRLTYISTDRVLGANVGFTVMQPLGRREGTFDLAVPTTQQTAGAKLRAQSDSGQVTGMGDLEFGPLFHWEIGDNQSANFVPTLVIPTGDYTAIDTNVPAALVGQGMTAHSQRLNMGYGNFYTFRPSAQYAFIGDGWDAGVRGVLSFNTRNKDNGYRSGNMLNIDWQLMKFVSEDVRVGLHGYLVRQFSDDSCAAGYGDPRASCSNRTFNRSTYDAVATGNRTSVDAVGPAVAWLKNGGEFLLEGKFLKEFNAKNRTEGQAFWLTLSKPL